MQQPTEFEVAGAHYRAQKMTAMKQFAVIRRLGKVTKSFAEALSAWQKRKADDPFAIVEPFLRALGDLSDEDVAFITASCLAVVSRHEKGGWARVTAGGGELMFADINESLLVLGTIIWNVLQDSLSDFFTELLSRLNALGAETPTGYTSPEVKTG